MGGKKNRAKERLQKKLAERQLSDLPFVSVCTPTFNRRPFIPAMLEIFRQQDYPKDKMEWIIIDDGTDSVKDLIDAAEIPQIKYFYVSEKMSLGKKRNMLHEKSSGEIIVYMDDDDYYPRDRVSHAVETLIKNPNALCSGSSQLFIYFNHNKKMYKFGPYGPNHATAGTFAFKSKMLKDTRYEDHAALAEEKAFLKNYTIPFVQLDPFKTILCFSHSHNTFDKRRLLENPNPKYVNETSISPNKIVKDNDLLLFFTEKIEKMLENYDPGRPEHKPDVLEQIKEKDAHRNAKNVHAYIENLQKVNMEMKAVMEKKDKQLQQVAEMYNKLVAKNKILEEKLNLIQEQLAKDAEMNQHM